MQQDPPRPRALPACLRVLGRRAWLALAMGGALARPHVARAAPATLLRVGTNLGLQSQFGQGARAMAERIEALSQGRIRIDLHTHGQLGTDADMLRAVEAGTLDMMLSGTLGSLVPAAGVFEVPFLFRDMAHAHAVLDGPIGAAVLRLVEPRGIIGLGWGENGLRHLTTRDRPVRSPTDLAGLKLRVNGAPVIMTTFRTLGAEPAFLEFIQLRRALEARQFDAQENPITVIESSGLWQVQKCLMLTGHVYSPVAFIMARASHDRLSPGDRDLLRQAVREGVAASRRIAAAAEREGIARLRGQGMEVVEVDRAAFARALAPAEPGFASTFGAERLAAIRTAAA
ncbi:TRAP transporter substrate-binding protein [Roseomonas sp. GC11]|uniref:TRAP transporter substrate-binding protein n=1 Tax=Roseomonas sp. GC11 TaxID=2950546 RepID=UPI00210AA2C4|nr:TRAP transporter substrate-binding protein [Roseomonas sp. GC11]MCQ4161589.1 TRAP transporter substrate-binding protein [Roseomonas sp. GC11]